MLHPYVTPYFIIGSTTMLSKISNECDDLHSTRNWLQRCWVFYNQVLAVISPILLPTQNVWPEHNAGKCQSSYAGPNHLCCQGGVIHPVYPGTRNSIWKMSVFIFVCIIGSLPLPSLNWSLWSQEVQPKNKGTNWICSRISNVSCVSYYH